MDQITPDNLLNLLFNDCKLARTEDKKYYALQMLDAYISEVEASNEENEAPLALIEKTIAKKAQVIEDQLNEIIHHPVFLDFEGNWRSIEYLVKNTISCNSIKLRVLNISKEDLLNDLKMAVEFDQSQLFKKVYEAEFGTVGGEPYSCLIGGYSFDRSNQDVFLLEKIAGVAAAAHAPFIAAASAKIMDFNKFTEISVPRDLRKIFDSTEAIKWNSFREQEDSRYTALVLPRVLIRAPYNMEENIPDGLIFNEHGMNESNDFYCWGNPAFVLAQRITNAVFEYNWPAAIRGVEGGGVVEDLPVHQFKTTHGDIVMKTPTEISITDRREKELSDLGFISLCHIKGTDKAVFFGGQTVQKPKQYFNDDATANANLSARLPYLLAASRFAHYIKAIMRDKVASFQTGDEVKRYLSNWIANYVLLNDTASQELKAEIPLREAKIEVKDNPDNPGSYDAFIFIRPHFQMEDLTASIRLVAKLPK